MRPADIKSRRSSADLNTKIRLANLSTRIRSSDKNTRIRSPKLYKHKKHIRSKRQNKGQLVKTQLILKVRLDREQLSSFLGLSLQWSV